MAKGNRGGKRKVNISVKPVNVVQPQPISPQPIQPAQTISSVYNNFFKMTKDQIADTIDKMIKLDIPDHLANNDFQKFIYNIGLNDKPQIVDDKTLDSMNGVEIFRTVNNVYDSKHDISYSADQIIKQIQLASTTRVSDNGGSVYGRGIYFADNKTGSSVYGNTRGDVKKTAQVRAKLNNNANIITYSRAYNGVNSEINSGTKLGKILKKCDSDSRVSIYALTNGYNVISNGRGYYNILNRNAMTMSKSIKAI